MARSYHGRFCAILILTAVFAVAAVFVSCGKQTPIAETGGKYTTVLSAQTASVTQTSAVGTSFYETQSKASLTEATSDLPESAFEPLLETKISATIEKIPCETEYVYSDDEYEDVSYVLKYGRDGLLQITKTGYYSDGRLAFEDSEETILSEPENEKILIGTKPVFTYETIKKNENTVKYSVKYVYDGNIYEGERRTKTYGADGYTVNTYKITYERGKEIKREVISSETVAPVDEVIVIGTKKKEETFALPFRTAAQGGADYRVTQYYGGSNSHGGIDFGVYYGAPITASMSGTVVYAYNDGYFSSSDLRWTYGTYVVIDHGNGYRTYYAHLKSRTVSVGDKVVQGQVIGYSGNTGRVSPAPTASNPYAGTHLHFEIRKYSQGSYVKVDPKKYLPQLN